MCYIRGDGGHEETGANTRGVGGRLDGPGWREGRVWGCWRPLLPRGGPHLCIRTEERASGVWRGRRCPDNVRSRWGQRQPEQDVKLRLQERPRF